MSNVLLVDGDNLLTIGFFALKNHFHKGEHIGGIYHFINTIRIFIDKHHLDKVVVFWDGENGSQTRRSYYHQYKQNRRVRIRTEEELNSYTRERNRVKQYLEDLYVRQGEYEYCESDDSIAYYVQNSPNENKIIFSGDGDLTQLVSEKTRIYNPSYSKMYQQNDMFTYEQEEILIENIKFVKMICGDKSDNIAGIKSLGITKLINAIPEIKERQLTLEYIRNKFNVLFENDKHNKSITNFITGVTKYGVLGEEFFQVNEKIVSLDSPFLTEDAKESISSLVNDYMDSEGRSYKNTMKMMIEDGLFLLLPKSDDAWIKFLNPFLRLTRKEKNKKTIKIKTNE
jgi:5'-3' exonuclease